MPPGGAGPVPGQGTQAGPASTGLTVAQAVEAAASPNGTGGSPTGPSGSTAAGGTGGLP